MGGRGLQEEGKNEQQVLVICLCILLQVSHIFHIFHHLHLLINIPSRSWRCLGSQTQWPSGARPVGWRPSGAWPKLPRPASWRSQSLHAPPLRCLLHLLRTFLRLNTLKWKCLQLVLLVLLFFCGIAPFVWFSIMITTCFFLSRADMQLIMICYQLGGQDEDQQDNRSAESADSADSWGKQMINLDFARPPNNNRKKQKVRCLKWVEQRTFQSLHTFFQVFTSVSVMFFSLSKL